MVQLPRDIDLLWSYDDSLAYVLNSFTPIDNLDIQIMWSGAMFRPVISYGVCSNTHKYNINTSCLCR